MHPPAPLDPGPRLGHALRDSLGSRERTLPHPTHPRPHPRRHHRSSVLVLTLPPQQGHHVCVSDRRRHPDASPARHLARPDPGTRRRPRRVRRARGRPPRDGRRLRRCCRRSPGTSRRRPPHHRGVRRGRRPGRRLLDSVVGRYLHARNPARLTLGACGRPRFPHVGDRRPHLHRIHQAHALLHGPHPHAVPVAHRVRGPRRPAARRRRLGLQAGRRPRWRGPAARLAYPPHPAPRVPFRWPDFRKDSLRARQRASQRSDAV